MVTITVLSGHARVAAVIVGLFIAALSYLEYQRILNVDWHKVQIYYQNMDDMVNASSLLPCSLQTF
jgi:uncharacterized membrane protein (Fun14 family)